MRVPWDSLVIQSVPKKAPPAFHWTQSAVAAGVRVVIPEIADYEVRRELLRAGRTKGLAQLDRLGSLLEYSPITTTIMRKAAELWAVARQRGRPTAGDERIDADVILAAHALSLGRVDTIIATTNVGHMTRFAAAERWETSPYHLESLAESRGFFELPCR